MYSFGLAMGMAPLLLALAVGSSAQSSYHLFPAGTLTETEMQTIASLEQLVWQSPKPTSVSNLSRTFGNTKGAEAKGHKLTMLHRELTHPSKHPELVARLLQLAREADAKAGFGIVQRLGKSGSDLHIRVAESLGRKLCRKTLEKLCDKERTRSVFVRDPSFVPERSVKKLTAERKIEFPPPTHQKINSFQSFFDELNFSCFFAFRLR